MQEGAVAQSFEVSTEVYSAIDSESDAMSTRQGQTQALTRISLGTQVGSDLPHSEGTSHALIQSTDDEEGPYLEIDLSKPPVEIVSQMPTLLQLTCSPIAGTVGLASLSDDDLVAFEQLMQTVGLEILPLLQPKQVACSGVRELAHALQGTQIEGPSCGF